MWLSVENGTGFSHRGEFGDYWSHFGPFPPAIRRGSCDMGNDCGSTRGSSRRGGFDLVGRSPASRVATTGRRVRDWPYGGHLFGQETSSPQSFRQIRDLYGSLICQGV